MCSANLSPSVSQTRFICKIQSFHIHRRLSFNFVFISVRNVDYSDLSSLHATHTPKINEDPFINTHEYAKTSSSGQYYLPRTLKMHNCEGISNTGQGKQNEVKKKTDKNTGEALLILHINIMHNERLILLYVKGKKKREKQQPQKTEREMDTDRAGEAASEGGSRPDMNQSL